MANSSGAGVLLALIIGIGVAQCSRGDASPSGSGSGSAVPLADLNGRVGQQMSMSGADVLSVPVDEGFWVDGGTGRVWVQIETPIESPFDVDADDSVSLTGRVVAHDAGFPARVGATGTDDAQDLQRQAAHISVALDEVGLDE